MATIKFSNGATVNFDGTPTEQDIEEIAKKLNIQPEKQASVPKEKSMAKKSVDTLMKIGNAKADLDKGFAKGVGRTVIDIGNLGGKMLSGITGQKIGSQEGTDYLKQKLAPTNTAQKIGGGIETVAEIASPTGIISKAKLALEGLKVAENIGKVPAVGKMIGFMADKVIKAIPETAVGYTYGGVKGGTQEEAKKSALTFGGLSVAGELLGGTLGLIKGTVKENVQKSIGVKGKVSMGMVTEKVNKGLDTFKTMANLKNDIKVKDVNGIEKYWEPTKDGFYELSQAFNQTKKHIYDAYTELARNEKVAGFTPQNFAVAENILKNLTKDTTSAFVGKAKNFAKDLKRNFATYNPETKQYYYKNVDLGRMQDFLEKVNKDVNPLSDKAGAEVSAVLSREIREIMDSKIMNATGEQYQKLRNAYSAAKAVEPELLAQLKRSFNGVGGGVADWVKHYGTMETISGALTGNPVTTAKGLGNMALGGIKKYLGNKENNLREVFKQLERGVNNNPVTKRLIGR